MRCPGSPALAPNYRKNFKLKCSAGPTTAHWKPLTNQNFFPRHLRVCTGIYPPCNSKSTLSAMRYRTRTISFCSRHRYSPCARRYKSMWTRFSSRAPITSLSSSAVFIFLERPQTTCFRSPPTKRLWRLIGSEPSNRSKRCCRKNARCFTASRFSFLTSLKKRSSLKTFSRNR